MLAAIDFPRVAFERHYKPYLKCIRAANDMPADLRAALAQYLHVLAQKDRSHPGWQGTRPFAQKMQKGNSPA